MSRTKQLSMALTALLQRENANTHQELCESLKIQGFSVTQSTVSRLLRKLGAIKGFNAKQEPVYLLAKKSPSITSNTTELKKLILNISHNEQVIVIQTTPGSANLIAHLLDFHRSQCYILGTLAGDDTILVIPTSTTIIADCLRAIEELML